MVIPYQLVYASHEVSGRSNKRPMGLPGVHGFGFHPELCRTPGYKNPDLLFCSVCPAKVPVPPVEQ
jgi:hypothetical protein